MQQQQQASPPSSAFPAPVSSAGLSPEASLVYVRQPTPMSDQEEEEEDNFNAQPPLFAKKK